ncbi:hypothetical protein VQ042_08440 [Aurantimonas sp. A2-1-M11]|uniref:hypothetical protein n=1 Tax=Aurantimonas sp. A2-1-M11 TaxID=3113712 RepID=UPI002F92684B
MATTLALSAWTGFAGLCSLRLLAHSGWLDPLAASPAVHGLLQELALAPEFFLPGQATLVFAALFAALATGLVMAISGLASPSFLAIRRAEPLAAAVLVALFAFYAAAAIAGSPLATLFGEGPGFLVSLALTFGALLFDRLVEVDNAADDAAFESVLRSIHMAEREAIMRRHRTPFTDKGETR